MRTSPDSRVKEQQHFQQATVTHEDQSREGTKEMDSKVLYKMCLRTTKLHGY